MGRGKIFSFAETKYEWNMKEISVSELQDNMFDAIGKEWMLVTAGTQDKFNMMTASWGGTGILWGKPVAFIFIRPERYTYEFIEEGDKLTLSFLGEEHKAYMIACQKRLLKNLDDGHYQVLPPNSLKMLVRKWKKALQETGYEFPSARELSGKLVRLNETTKQLSEYSYSSIRDAILKEDK